MARKVKTLIGGAMATSMLAATLLLGGGAAHAAPASGVPSRTACKQTVSRLFARSAADVRKASTSYDVDVAVLRLGEDVRSAYAMRLVVGPTSGDRVMARFKALWRSEAAAFKALDLAGQKRFVQRETFPRMLAITCP